MVNLAALYSDTGRLDEAEPLLLTALDADRRELGPDNPETLITMTALSTVYVKQKRYEEADRLRVEILSKRRRILGENHPYTLASLAGLGWLRALQGETDEALDLLRQAIEGGYTNWGHPGGILKQWTVFDGNPEYESIVADLRKSIDEQ